MTYDLDDIRTSYDTVATSYAERVQGGDAWEVTSLDLFAKLVSGGPVLDAGCGPGRWSVCCTTAGCRRSASISRPA